jgi:hypothetical protein
MDVEIGELSSTVRMTDSQALLDPRLVERLVAIVMKQMRDAAEREKRSREERELRPKVSARKAANWK